MADEEPLIIVDEGWKAKVQREKEEAATAKAAAETSAANADAAPADTAPAEPAPAAPVPEDAQPVADTAAPESGAREDAPEEGAPTPFNELVASLAAQTMYALGVIAQEGQGQVTVNLDQAQFAIDMLLMLRKKTQGNLTADESKSLTEALGELQQIFLARLQQMQAQQMEQSGVDLDNLRQPEV